MMEALEAGPAEKTLNLFVVLLVARAAGTS